MNININLLPTHPRSKLYSFIIPFFLLLLFTSSSILPNQSEFTLYAGNAQGTQYFQMSVKLYNLNYNLIYSGTSALVGLGSPFGSYTPNVVADMTDGGNDTNNPTFGPIVPRSYYLRVGNKYIFLNIPDFNEGQGAADFLITFINNIFEVAFDNRGINLGSTTYDWVEYTITVKNSFGGGSIIVDYQQYDNIGVNGKTFFPWIESSNHTLKSNDQIFADASGTFMRRFQNWTDEEFFNSTSNPTSITVTDNNTYTANFLNEYNITFQNSFSSATGGIIKVNSTQQNAPHQTTALQNGSITATALTQTINDITYSFSNWSNGSTTATTVFSPDSHFIYTANFTGKPSNTNRNLTFGGNVGQKIELNWNEHPHDSVTKYKIWRKVRHNGVTGNPSLIATVNRGTTTYTD